MRPDDAYVNEIDVDCARGFDVFDSRDVDLLVEIRRVPVQLVDICRSDVSITDTITVHRPAGAVGARRAEHYPGKRFALTADGTIEKPLMNRSGWFRSTVYRVGSVDDLHAVCEAVRTGEPGYLISGDLAPGADPRSSPRTKSAKTAATGKRRPQGVADAHRRWIVLDVDGVTNVNAIDPRECGDAREEAIAFLRGLLPPELATARTSWQLSSSCCVRGLDDRPLPPGTPPATLGAHLRVWLDEALDERGRRDLLTRIRGYTAAVLAERGIPGGCVDPAPATSNQPIFLTASFECGMRDPLPIRSGIADGRDVVRLSVLDVELPAAAVKTRKPRPTLAVKTDAESARRQHDGLLRGARRADRAASTLRALPISILDIPGIRRPVRIAGRNARAKVFSLSRVRKIQDVLRIVADRRERDPAWAAGIPVGSRRRTMLCVAGILSHFVPASALPQVVADVAEVLVDREWLELEFFGTGQLEFVAGKARVAEALEAAGRPADGVRLDPWNARLLEILRPTHDEMVRLRLRALTTGAARQEGDRRSKGVPTLEERRTREATTSDRQTKPWIAEGLSERTWRRRRAEAAAAAKKRATDLETATLTDDGVADVVALVRYATGDIDALTLLESGFLGGVGLDAAVQATKARPAYEGRVFSAMADAKRLDTPRRSSAIRLLGDLYVTGERAPARIVVGIAMKAYLPWAATHAVGARRHSVSAMLASTAAYVDALSWLRELSAGEPSWTAAGEAEPVPVWVRRTGGRKPKIREQEPVPTAVAAVVELGEVIMECPF